jgi:glycosyltransferase involved in cell wall biosynthesis
VASHLVPFVAEYLLGQQVKTVKDYPAVKQGSGALVVQADDVDGFACALALLLSNDALRREMGKNAFRATIPYFTWENVVRAFLEKLNI